MIPGSRVDKRASGALADTYPLWHPNTDMKYFREHGITLVEGEGIVVRDSEGQEYISATGGLWNTALGFANYEIISAITEQLNRLPYGTLFRYGNELAQRLAGRIAEVTGLDRVFLTTSGSGAVETGLKIARGYFYALGDKERQLVVSLDASYHGIFYGGMSVTGEDIEQHKYGVDRSLSRQIPTPRQQDSAVCIEALVDLLEREGERTAAVILEPVIGSGGVIIPPQEFFDAIIAARESYGFLIVADEVATGFGRTGTMFASEHFGLSPDVMTLSKGINSGYLPLGAVAASDRVYQGFMDSGSILTGETQAGNPASCAAALATIEIIERDRILNNVQCIGGLLTEQLRGVEDYRHVRELRALGLMLGIELACDKESGRPAEMRDVVLVVELLRREGLLVHPAPNGISLFPPLILSEEDAEDIANILHSVLRRLHLQG